MSQSLRMARLLNVLNAFREDVNLNSLTQDEERILGFIYERECKKLITTVSDIVFAHSFGTPPTVQRKINKLSKNGMLVYRKDRLDLRKQHLVLSDAAVQYLEDLARYLATEFE